MFSSKKIVLKKGEVISKSAGTYSVSCSSGSIWVSQSGHLEDFLISSGHVVEFKVDRGTLVVESLADAVVEISKSGRFVAPWSDSHQKTAV